MHPYISISYSHVRNTHAHYKYYTLQYAHRNTDPMSKDTSQKLQKLLAFYLV